MDEHKHGTKHRKVWRKLHLAINEDGEILSATLIAHHESDVSQVPDLLKQIDTPIDVILSRCWRIRSSRNVCSS